MSRDNQHIIEAFSGIRQIYESSEPGNVDGLAVSGERWSVALNEMKLLYDQSPFLKNEAGSEWVLKRESYNSLYEIYLQYFLTITAIELKKKGALHIPISHIALRVVKTSGLVSEYINAQGSPFHYIVLSTGYYELLFVRGLLQESASIIGDLTGLDDSLITNHIGGFTFVSALSKYPVQSNKLINFFFVKLISSLKNEPYLVSVSKEKQLTQNNEIEVVFFDAVQNLLNNGSPDIFAPIRTITKYFPIFFMLFSMFHELSHLSHGLIEKLNLRNLKEEFSCDLLSIYHLYVIDRYIMLRNSKKIQYPLLAPLATALFCDINHMVAAIKEYPSIMNDTKDDLQSFYAENVMELEQVTRMIEQIGLREFPLIESRILSVSASFGLFSERNEKDIDLFFDCYSELKIGSIFIIDRLTMPLPFDFNERIKKCKDSLDESRKQAHELYLLGPQSLEGRTLDKSAGPNEFVMRLVIYGFHYGIECLRTTNWLSPILLSKVNENINYEYFYCVGERLSESLKKAETAVKNFSEETERYAIVYLGWINIDGSKKDVIFVNVGERNSEYGYKFSLPYDKDNLPQNVTDKEKIIYNGRSELLW